MRTFKVNLEKAKEDTLVYSGLLGISVIAVVQLLGTSVIDKPLTVSLYAFAVAIPMLAISIYAVAFEASYEYTVIPIYMDIANFGGPLASIIGTAGLFWHFSRLIGITFLSFPSKRTKSTGTFPGMRHAGS